MNEILLYHLLFALIHKTKRMYACHLMPLISAIALVLAGVYVPAWLAILSVFASVLMVSFGELLKFNVRRDLHRAQKFITGYRKLLINSRRIFLTKRGSKRGIVEFMRVMRSLPFPRRMVYAYLLAKCLFLFVYVYLMGFTCSVAARESGATYSLFLVQLATLLLVYFSAIIRIFGQYGSLSNLNGGTLEPSPCTKNVPPTTSGEYLLSRV